MTADAAERVARDPLFARVPIHEGVLSVALVGYGTYRGLLGHVDQQSPAEWVNPDASTDMVWRRIRR